MTYIPLHHKYRPQTFAQLVGQEAIATTLSSALTQNRIAPAYLFTGARGTGKTSSARIFAKSLNCISVNAPTPEPCGTCEVCQEITKGNALDIIEIDAASNTGVDSIRELIERSQFAPVRCRYKVYIIDECHMLTSAAFNALLKTLEEPPDRVIFVLATTDPQRVLPTIISRCQRFDFRRIPLDSLVQHLGHIAHQESISIAPEALHLVGQISQGGLRDAESLLDQLSLSPDEVSVEKVWDLVGAVPERDLMALVQAIVANDAESTVDLTRKLMDRGREPLIVLQNLASFYRDLAIAKTSPNRNDLAAITPPTWNEMTQFVQAIPLNQLLQSQQQLRSAELQIKNTTQPRLWLEITLMGLLPSALAIPEASSTRPSVIPIQSIKPQIPHPTTPPQPNQSVTPTVQAKQPTPIAHTPPIQTTQPTPIANTPTPQHPNTPTPIDLDKLWQEILANIEEIPSRAVLSANCHLLGVNGNEIKIGVFQKTSLKIVKDRAPQLGKACSKTLKGPVKMMFTVEGKGLSGKAPEVQPTLSVEPPTQTLRSQIIQPQIKSPVIAAIQTPVPIQSQPVQSKPIQTQAPIATPIAAPIAPTHDAPDDLYQPTNFNNWEVDELSRAAKSLADAFNGKVITLDVEEDESEGEAIDRSPEDSQEPAMPTIEQIMNEPELDFQQSDVPF